MSVHTVQLWIVPDAASGPGTSGSAGYRLSETDREAFVYFRGNIAAAHRARAAVQGPSLAAGARPSALVLVKDDPDLASSFALRRTPASSYTLALRTDPLTRRSVPASRPRPTWTPSASMPRRPRCYWLPWRTAAPTATPTSGTNTAVSTTTWSPWGSSSPSPA